MSKDRGKRESSADIFAEIKKVQRMIAAQEEETETDSPKSSVKAVPFVTAKGKLLAEINRLEKRLAVDDKGIEDYADKITDAEHSTVGWKDEGGWEDQNTKISEDEDEDVTSADDDEEVLTSEDEDDELVSEDEEEMPITSDDDEEALTSEDEDEMPVTSEDEEEMPITSDDLDEALASEDEDEALASEDEDDELVSEDEDEEIVSADEDEDEEAITSADDEDEDIVSADDEEEEDITSADDEDEDITSADDEDEEAITSSRTKSNDSMSDMIGDNIQTTRPPKAVTPSFGPGVTSQKGLDVVNTNYVKARIARLEEASARLDRVSNYLEKNKKMKTALVIDRIADEIDRGRRILQHKLVAAETFKCPECGTKVLKNTGYCVKCKKKVKQAKRMAK